MQHGIGDQRVRTGGEEIADRIERGGGGIVAHQRHQRGQHTLVAQVAPLEDGEDVADAGARGLTEEVLTLDALQVLARTGREVSLRQQEPGVGQQRPSLDDFAGIQVRLGGLRDGHRHQMRIPQERRSPRAAIEVEM